jgi:diguanylate cyclase (GGDEF)-like protein
MDKYTNKKLLYTIPIIFLFVLLVRIFYSYTATQTEIEEFAKKEAQSLNSHALSHRKYYQQLYFHKIIPLNEETLKGLPAYSSYYINEAFSKNNPFNISIQTVSDRARDVKNRADSQEIQAINYLRKHPDKKEYFSSKDKEYYQYASALIIQQKCLKCHGTKKSAPLFIQKRYKKAYDYKLGELRGIISIKIPKAKLHKYFFQHFYYSVLYDTFAFIVLFLVIYATIQKSRKMNDFLHKAILFQTKKLKETLVKERLTGLPNRLQFLEDIQQTQNANTRHLALINIDKFKDINDFYGHNVGDKLLVEVGLKIDKFCADEHSTIYKLPSDEYAIFTAWDIPAEKFHKKIEELIQILQKEPYHIQNHAVFISVSCGIASNEKDIIIKADMALQVAKSSKADLVIYSNLIDTKESVNKNIQGIALLKDAIENDRIQPYFQPIYNLHTKKIEKYESLIRIINAKGEIIAPYHFLDIAVKSKLYHHLTYAMVEKSFNFFADKEEYEFSINLSIDDILNERTVAFIIDKLSSYSSPQRVVFEILESHEIENYEDIKEFIQKVKYFGSKIAIDDFGSGYSNFSHVLELNVDYLKIDASLIRNITTNENSRKITETLVSFAQKINLQTIAEYVENEEALNLLQELGIDFVQGYYIGKPQATLL